MSETAGPVPKGWLDYSLLWKKYNDLGHYSRGSSLGALGRYNPSDCADLETTC